MANRVFENDFDKLKINNPTLYNKLKKKFDVGRQIFYLQLINGLDRTNENTLRSYLLEFGGRFLKFGPDSFPSSFNPLEPFFKINHDNSIIELHSEEESYVVSLIDFLDFATHKTFNLDKIDFYENIHEGLVYHFSFDSDFSEITFSNNGTEFVIGSLSMIRKGDEVSMLLQAGEYYDKNKAEEYFESHTKDFVSGLISPTKKAIGLKIDNDVDPMVVNFEGRDDLWAHNIIMLFDLKARAIDIRHVARDENISFKVFTDDYFALFGGETNLTEEDIRIRYEKQLRYLSNYDSVFDFAKYCLALPLYIFINEEKIIDVVYETDLKSVIKGPSSKRNYGSVPNKYKVFTRTLYYLESINQDLIQSKELSDKSFKVEKSGYWKRLENDEVGFDKRGNKIIGKTWVERNESYFTLPKRITTIQKNKHFEGENSGYIYIMRQPAHDENTFKVGLTKRSPEKRRKELSNTSSPDKFYIIHSFFTKDCVEAEKLIHSKLDLYRLTKRREFFNCDLQIILNICNEVVNKINKS